MAILNENVLMGLGRLAGMFGADVCFFANKLLYVFLARTLETALKWMTGVLSSVAILLFIFSIFCGCYMRRVSLHPETQITLRPFEKE